MVFLTQNIKYLRKQNGWTQQKLADELEIKRALIGAYEEGRATPKLAVLQEIAVLFHVSVDDLIGVDLEKGTSSTEMGKDIHVLPIVVNEQNEELIPIVPVKASAGYLNGFADPEFIESLPRFEMPIPELSKEQTYRVFQIKGDSMLPVLPGSYAFCEYVEDFNDLKDGQTYILITMDEGLVYKRIYRQDNNQLLLKSDNIEYEPYSVSVSSVLEIWKARGILSFDLPSQEQTSISQLSTQIKELRNEIKEFRS